MISLSSQNKSSNCVHIMMVQHSSFFVRGRKFCVLELCLFARKIFPEIFLMRNGIHTYRNTYGTYELCVCVWMLLFLSFENLRRTFSIWHISWVILILSKQSHLVSLWWHEVCVTSLLIIFCCCSHPEAKWLFAYWILIRWVRAPGPRPGPGSCQWCDFNKYNIKLFTRSF